MDGELRAIEQPVGLNLARVVRVIARLFEQNVHRFLGLQRDTVSILPATHFCLVHEAKVGLVQAILGVAAGVSCRLARVAGWDGGAVQF